jgi:hypothetical protein
MFDFVGSDDQRQSVAQVSDYISIYISPSLPTTAGGVVVPLLS